MVNHFYSRYGQTFRLFSILIQNQQTELRDFFPLGYTYGHWNFLSPNRGGIFGLNLDISPGRILKSMEDHDSK